MTIKLLFLFFIIWELALIFVPICIDLKVDDLIDDAMSDIKFLIERLNTSPFIVSEYYDRMGKSALDILESQEPVDQTIILWWGLDGLRLNEDGSLEWISRKKPETVYMSDRRLSRLSNLLDQCANTAPTPEMASICQNTQAKISALQAVEAQNAIRISELRDKICKL